MQETTISVDHTHSDVSIYTSRRSERDAFVRRLEEYDWDYEVEDQESEGEWVGAFIEVPWKAIRRPYMLVSTATGD